VAAALKRVLRPLAGGTYMIVTMGWQHVQRMLVMAQDSECENSESGTSVRLLH
jgi:hypothetical protein